MVVCFMIMEEFVRINLVLKGRDSLHRLPKSCFGLVWPGWHRISYEDLDPLFH